MIRLTSVLLSMLCVPAMAAEPLVLLNGTVYTANPRGPRAEAVIAVDGRITFVGSNAQARQRAPRTAQLLDLKGLTVFPGLTDAHAHLDGIGARELSFNVEGASSLADLKARLRAQAAKTRAGEWIAGSGWIESRWTPAVFPTRNDLDEVVSDRPVLLERVDGHGAVANSRALALAGIDRHTPDPAGGAILKDARGEPNGMLIDNAMALVSKLVPPPTEAQLVEQLEVGAARSVRLGWTQLQIAGNSFREVDQLCALYKQGRIKLRLYDAVDGPGPDADRLLKEGPSLDRCSDRFTVRGIKLYIDGALGSRGAALLEPYDDAPGNKGLLVADPQSLMPLLTAALRRGVQIETHAIGDRGNRIVLDTYEKAFAAVPAKERAIAEPRWRIEHAQHLTASDIPRFRQLGVIASMQPAGAISDLYFAPSRLGGERLAYGYAWRSLLDAGAVVAAGSDAPVEKGDPIIEFYAAVARRSQDGFADANWHREQRVTREQALHMLSSAPAYAAFQEKDRGTIEVGKQADFTVFSADLMTIPEAEILTSRVVMTIIGGEVAWSEPRSARASPAQQTDCDRGCLEGFVERYLEALQRKDPSRLPWAPKARFTENNVELAVGDGLWATISGLGAYRLKVADPSTGQAGFFGVVEETVASSAFAMRLRIENQRIAEVETLVVRLADMGSLGGGSNPFEKAVFADKPVFQQSLAPAERRPRERLISIADGYFDTLQLNDGVLFTQFDPDCVRVENGVQTTGNPARPLGEISALGCADQFRLGYYRYDDRLRARRFPLVDEERGLVLASGFIDHAGRLGQYTLTDGRVVDSPLRRPHTFYLLELFKIRDGKILQIEAAFTTVPYRMPSPWS